jgi:hypothetical protein
MSKEGSNASTKSELQVVTLDIGDGNPFTAQVIASRMGCECRIAQSVYPAAVMHRLMSRNPHLSQLYTREQDKVRNSGVFGAMGIAAALELGPQLRFDGGHRIIAVQELTLKAIDLWCTMWGIRVPPCSFVIPDVCPKPTGIPIIRDFQEKYGLDVFTWNGRGCHVLEQNGIRPTLISPSFCLPEGYAPSSGSGVGEVFVYKTSGSGAPAVTTAFMRGVVPAMFPHLRHRVITPGEVITIEPGTGNMHCKKRGQDRVSVYYEMMEDSPLILSAGPGEVAMVAAGMRLNGWNGIVFLGPPRGLHEVDNGKFMGDYGLAVPGIVHGPGTTLSIFAEIMAHTGPHHGSASCRQLSDAIGKRSLYELLG